MKIDEFNAYGPGDVVFRCVLNFSKRAKKFWLKPVTHSSRIDNKLCHNLDSYDQAKRRFDKLAEQAFTEEMLIGSKILVGVVSSEIEKQPKPKKTELKDWKPITRSSGNLDLYGVILGFSWCRCEEYNVPSGSDKKWKFIEGSDTIRAHYHSGFHYASDFLSSMSITELEDTEMNLQFCRNTESKFRELYGFIASVIQDQDKLQEVVANQAKLIPEATKQSLEI